MLVFALEDGFFTTESPGKPYYTQTYFIHLMGYILQFRSVQSLSRVRLFVTPWTVTYQALLSMGLSRQEYWHGLPFPPPEDLPDPGLEPMSLMSPELATSLPLVPPGKSMFISFAQN